MTEPSRDTERSSTALTSPAYVASFVALVALTLASYWLSYAHLGAFEVFVALGIAALKVTIVGLFFMHLVKEPPSHRIAAIGAILFVILLAVFAAADVFTRHS